MSTIPVDHPLFRVIELESFAASAIPIDLNAHIVDSDVRFGDRRHGVKYHGLPVGPGASHGSGAVEDRSWLYDRRVPSHQIESAEYEPDQGIDEVAILQHPVHFVIVTWRAFIIKRRQSAAIEDDWLINSREASDMHEKLFKIDPIKAASELSEHPTHFGEQLLVRVFLVNHLHLLGSDPVATAADTHLKAIADTLEDRHLAVKTVSHTV